MRKPHVAGHRIDGPRPESIRATRSRPATIVVVNRVRADLARFYEHEAANRLRGRPAGWRVEWLEEFVRIAIEDGARSVLDVGAGPGSDAPAFLSAGIDYVGVDLARTNALLAAEAGAAVIAASLFDLPFPDSTFEAAWSMSTLMHVPEAEVADALSEITRVLVPGALLMVGQWGGSLGDIDSDHTAAGLPRLFSLRTAERNRELLANHTEVVRWEVRDVGPAGWEYHGAVLRRRG